MLERHEHLIRKRRWHERLGHEYSAWMVEYTRMVEHQARKHWWHERLARKRENEMWYWRVCFWDAGRSLNIDVLAVAPREGGVDWNANAYDNSYYQTYCVYVTVWRQASCNVLASWIMSNTGNLSICSNILIIRREHLCLNQSITCHHCNKCYNCLDTLCNFYTKS